LRPNPRLQPCPKAIKQETSVASRSFSRQIKAEKQSMESVVIDMDRRVIRIDVPPEHAGVMAALRRAFDAAASEPSDRDFDELLRRLS